MMIFMYASPILYDVSMVPEKYQKIYMLNPITRLILAYKAIMYDKVSPDILNLLTVGAISVVVLIVGYLVFNKLQRKFAEEL